jgi:DNA-binding XRE family transcriptional regulator
MTPPAIRLERCNISREQRCVGGVRIIAVGRLRQPVGHRVIQGFIRGCVVSPADTLGRRRRDVALCWSIRRHENTIVHHAWHDAWTGPCAACDGPRVQPSPTADKTLAAVLRRLREERGQSQEAVAFRAGITTGTFARIELGQSSPSWVTVRRIAEALDVNLADLGAAIEDAA